ARGGRGRRAGPHRLRQRRARMRRSRRRPRRRGCPRSGALDLGAAHLMAAAAAHLPALVRKFPALTVAVWGDFVADEFIAGEIARVSREAPVLILKRRSRVWAAGGGANAAVNLAALGVKVRLVGVVGDDEPGRGLLQIFQRHGIDTRGVMAVPRRLTPT